jgi:hypothetical protein
VSIIKHNELRKTVFSRPFVTCCRLEYILELINEHKVIKQATIQNIILQERVAGNTIRGDLVPYLKGLVSVYSLRPPTAKKAQPVVTLTEMGVDYLMRVKECYNN